MYSDKYLVVPKKKLENVMNLLLKNPIQEKEKGKITLQKGVIIKEGEYNHSNYFTLQCIVM